MIKIAFNLSNIDVRGTATSGYDYAVALKDFYNIDSIILGNINSINDDIAIDKFRKRFKLYFYSNFHEINDIVKYENCNLIYSIKYGTKEYDYKFIVPEVIHCVFDMSQPHGHVYAGVSKYVANKYGYNLYVPHMISLKPSLYRDNMRKILNIPEDSLVFGRYGGQDTFNIDFVKTSIINIVNKYKNIYFLFINTPTFYIHKQIYYLDKIIDNDIKNKFLCTLNAFIEAGTLGHSFGLACGEASVNNIPIILYESHNLWNRAHIDIIGDKGIYFKNENEFYDIITNFNPNLYKNIDLNTYKDYMPQKVIKIFKEVFIDNCLKHI
jgi:hypothetical protein